MKFSETPERVIPRRSKLTLSVAQSKRKLKSIKEVEMKVNNRVNYLSKEEERIINKMNVMKQRFDSRHRVFRERESDLEELELARANRVRMLEEKK